MFFVMRIYQWQGFHADGLYEWGVFVNPQLQPVINLTKSDPCTFGLDDC